MPASDNALYMPRFSHIYVEKQIGQHPMTEHILDRFPSSTAILIDHYKDVFARSKQHFARQKQAMKLILAAKNEPFLYAGSDVAQDFGFEHFYYTSSILNCLYNCEYCFLQGMFPSANLVMFVNFEDYVQAVKVKLRQHPVYLCVSYESDLLALDKVAPFASKWLAFAAEQPGLTIELRTKSVHIAPIRQVQPQRNVILAWTLSPQAVIDQHEHGTPSLEARLNAIRQVMDDGWNVRLSFDPVLHVRDWENHYEYMLEQTFARLPASQIVDVSIGVFRMSRDYLKKMRRENSTSPLIHYPFEVRDGVYSYPKSLSRELISFVYERVQQHVSRTQIFTS